MAKKSSAEPAAPLMAAKWLLHIPKRYKDFTAPKNTFPDADGEKHLISCRLLSVRAFSAAGVPVAIGRGASRVALQFEDDRGNVAKAMVFGAVWEWRGVPLNERVLVYAATSFWNNYLQLDQPKLVPSSDVGRVYAVYNPKQIGEKKAISGDEIASMAKESFVLLDEAAQIVLEELRADEVEFVELFGMTPAAMLRGLHFPLTMASGLELRSVAQSVATEIMIRRAERNAVVGQNTRSALALDRMLVGEMAKKLPYQLTADQKKAVQEIFNDLISDRPMRRMLSGDVGTGKSLTFMLPAAAAVLAGYRVAIVTPNQLLVDQLAREMAEMFQGVPTQVIKPGGTIRPDGGLVIGTTSVIYAAERCDATFDFVVTDEEHKFSVDQKLALIDSHTNLLNATATPIPRSIALVACNGMSLSTLEMCPVEKSIKSLLVGPDKKIDLLSFIGKKICDGQVAVVYPAVFDAENVLSIQENAGKWEKLFPGQVAVLHGKMNDKEKKATLGAMLDGSRKILVASTVIEIGVTLPDLKAMVVVNPEMFGASQLHQLRGRVARRGGEGFFIMYCPDVSVNEDSLTRLNMVKSTNNGFALAEKDMELRGFGDLDISGESQSGDGKIVFHGLDIPVSRVVAAMAARA